MAICKDECLVVQERALVMNLCDGRGQHVRVEMTAGSLSPSQCRAHAGDLEPGTFSLVDGDLVHVPPRAGAWGLAFRVLANDSHYQNLCSLFVTGYSEAQKQANNDKPLITACVLPIGSTEVVRETPGEALMWTFAPEASAHARLFHIHLQLGTLKTQGGEVTCAGLPRDNAGIGVGARSFPHSQSIRIGTPVTLILRLEEA